MLTTLYRAAFVAALLLLAACERPASSEAPSAEQPKNLRVYTVPAERAAGLRDALAGALGDSGRVSLAPPDRLIVVAPVALQTSVAENLGELLKATPRPAPTPTLDPAPVRLAVWIVDVSEDSLIDPRLQAVQSTLDALQKTLSAPGFKLHGQIGITANVGNRGPSTSAGDGRVYMHAQLMPADGGVHAEIRMNAGRMEVSTQTRLKFGETVVLAQAMPEGEGGSKIRLVIVRADPAN